MIAYERLICLVIGYFFGCFQTSYIFGRIFKKIDIREHGSGNAGANNTVRVMGTKFGITIFLFDVVKAMSAFILCSYIFNGTGTFASFGDAAAGVLPGIYAGLGVVLGHNFPVFLKFKGGKGIASSVGVILCLDWRVAVIVFAVGLTAIIITRFVSLGAILVTGLFPFVTFFFTNSIEIIALCFIFGALAVFMHRGNIVRLVSGNERKFVLLTKGSINEKS